MRSSQAQRIALLGRQRIVLALIKDDSGRWRCMGLHQKKIRKEKWMRCFLRTARTGFYNAGVLRTRAQAKLDDLTFEGPKRNWNLQTLCTAVLEQYTIFDRYAPKKDAVDEEQRVTDFCRKIKDPRYILYIIIIAMENSGIKDH